MTLLFPHRCEVGVQELPKNSALGRLRGSDNVVRIHHVFSHSEAKIYLCLYFEKQDSLLGKTSECSAPVETHCRCSSSYISILNQNEPSHRLGVQIRVVVSCGDVRFI